MKKELGISVGFTGKDQGLKAMFRGLGKDIKAAGDALKDIEKGEKGWLAVKTNQLVELADKAQEFVSSTVKNVSKIVQGSGVTDEFKTMEGLANRMTLRLGDAGVASKVLRDNIHMLTTQIGIVWDDAVGIVGAFEKNGLAVEKFSESLKKIGKLSLAFKIDAENFAQSFAEANKNLKLSESTLGEFTDKLAFVEGKTGLSGIVAAFPRMITQVQDAVSKGIIKPSQAKQYLKGVSDVTALMRAGGLSIDQASSVVDQLTNNIKNIRGALSAIIRGEGGALGEVAKNSALIRSSFAEIHDAYAAGDLNKVMNKMLEVSGRIRTETPEAYMAFTELIEKNFGTGMMQVINAASSEGFKAMKGTLANATELLKEGALSKAATGVMDTLADTIENRMNKISGIEKSYTEQVSKNISKSQKMILEAEAKIKEERLKAARGDKSAALWARLLESIQQFRQGGIIAIDGFVSSTAKLLGKSEEDIMKYYAAFKEFGPIVETIGGAFKDVLAVLASLAGVLSIFGVKFDKAGKMIERFFVNLGKFIFSPLKSIKKGFSIMYQTVLSWAKVTINAAKSVAITLWNVAKSPFKYIGMMMSGVATAARAMWIALTGPVGLIVGGLTLIVGAFVLAYKKITPFREFIDSMWNGFIEGLKWVGNQVGNIVGKIAGAIKSIMPDWLIKIITKGSNFVVGAVKSAKEAILPSSKSEDVTTISAVPRRGMQEFADVALKKETYTLKDLAVVLVQGFGMVVDAIQEQDSNGGGQIAFDSSGIIKYMNKTASTNLQNAGISG